MADNSAPNGLRIVGTIIMVIGYAWLAMFFFGGFALLREFGFDSGRLGTFGTSIIPAFILIAVGRGIRRRGRVDEPELSPTDSRPATSQRSRSSRAEPVSDAMPETLEPDRARQASKQQPVARPKPETRRLQTERTTVARTLEEALAEMEGSEARDESVAPGKSHDPTAHPGPKTSEEMIADARKRWGDNRI